MAVAHASTTEFSGAADCRSRARLSSVRSSSVIDNAHQRGACTDAPLSRGHHACVVSNQSKKGFSFSNRALTFTPDDWRGLNCAPSFSRIQIGWFSPSRRPLRCSSRCIGHNSPGRAVTMAAPGAFHSPHSAACRRFCAQSIPHQKFIQGFADVGHLSRLSSSVSLRPEHNGRRGKVWRYQFQIMRCPK